MKLTPQQRREIQSQLEAVGWRAVDTAGGFVLEPPERLKDYNSGFIYPLGHPAKLPEFPIAL